MSGLLEGAKSLIGSNALLSIALGAGFLGVVAFAGVSWRRRPDGVPSGAETLRNSVGLGLVAIIFALSFAFGWISIRQPTSYLTDFQEAAQIALGITVVLFLILAAVNWWRPNRLAPVLVAAVCCGWMVVGLSSREALAKASWAYVIGNAGPDGAFVAYAPLQDDVFATTIDVRFGGQIVPAGVGVSALLITAAVAGIAWAIRSLVTTHRAGRK